MHGATLRQIDAIDFMALVGKISDYALSPKRVNPAQTLYDNGKQEPARYGWPHGASA